MPLKKELRKELLSRRASVPDKSAKDDLIADKLINSAEFINAETVLCYVSFNNEIATDRIIISALNSGKRVAVPHCVNKRGKMDFYLINSLDELTVGTFGIREPDINFNKRLEDFENSIIIVPGAAFTAEGFRIGYGGGYYDRFLGDYGCSKIGLCYEDMLCDSLPVDEYDVPANIVITESRIIYTNGG